MKKTLIIGASIKPERYAYKAAQKLIAHQHPIEMIGRREDILFEKKINTEKVQFEDIHTVTLYVGQQHQSEYYDYIITMKPQRVIFNPGTENEAFESLLKQNNIEAERACTLVLLASGVY